VTTRGTCPACLRELVVKDGVMVKHGWREFGTRMIAHYGRVHHSGQCFGAGRPPFEVSPRGMEEFVEQRVRPALRIHEEDLARLAARPTLTKTRHGALTGKVTTTQLHPGGTTATEILDYEDELKRRTRKAQSDLELIRIDLEKRERMLASWTPKPLVGEPARPGKAPKAAPKTPKAVRLSPSQRETLEAMARADGRIFRLGGGFWTTSTFAKPWPEGWHGATSVEPPREAWWTGIQTVRSLERLGLVERAGVMEPDWKAARRITDRGRALVG
jgi:hypothetical protein